MRRRNKGFFLKISRGKKIQPIRQKKKWNIFRFNFKKIGIFLGIVMVIAGLFSGYYYFGQYISFSFQPHRSEKIISPFGSENTVDNLKKEISEKNLMIDNLTVKSDGSSVSGKLPEGIAVIFSLSKDVKWQVSTLQQLVEELTIENGTSGNKKPTSIDFRYDKPIVKF